MFYSIKNLVDHQARPVEKPWDLVNNAPYGMKKPEFKKWSLAADTDHHWINLCQGISPNVRITADGNPVYEVSGIIADYDAPLPCGYADLLKTKPPCEYLPQWLYTTQSGNFRIIWMFEKPFRFTSGEHFHEYMKHALNVLKLDKWGAGLDTGRLVQPGTYYELGKDWTRLSDYVIPYSSLCAWDFIAFIKASKNTSLSLDGVAIEVPLEVVAKKVEEMYPGRWSGEFKEGARGVRFWDSAADNPTGAMVTKDGMRVYTPHDNGFRSWIDLFGRKFAEEFIGDREKNVIEHAYYDETCYWFEAKPGKWERENTEKFTQSLKVLGYDNKCGKGETASEIDRIQVRVRRERRIDGASPVVYRPTGLVFNPDARKWILNTRSILPVKPAAPSLPPNCPWGDASKSFPLIHRVLSQMFIDQHDDHDTPVWLAKFKPDEQLMTLLAWLKRSYEGGLAMSPTVGQVLILVGPPGKGKTLVNRKIIGGLLGGSADGTRHLLEGEKFNGDLVEAPVVTLDDPVGDKKRHHEFELRLKQIVANGTWRVEVKFQPAADAPWCGRIVISCNEDKISMELLPSLSASNREKVTMLKCGSQRIRFSDSFDENQKRVDMELPAFGRWLLDWMPPASLIRFPRYGVVPFHHPDLVNTISENGNVGTFLSVVDYVFHNSPPSADGKDYWEGTSAELFELLSAAAPNLMRGITLHVICSTLSLMRNNKCDVGGVEKRGRQVMWKIPHDQTKLHPNNEIRPETNTGVVA